MEPILTEEQRLLADSVAKHLAQAGGVKRTRGLRGGDGGFDRAAHQRMAAEGWLGLMVPAERGGLGLGLTELGLVMIAAGRALVPEPIAASAAAARAIARGPSSKAGADLLAAVVEGRTIVMPAIGIDAAQVRADGDARSVVLDGTQSGVAMATACDGFLVAAERRGGQGLLAFVPRDAKGVTLAPRATVDGRPIADVRLERAKAELIVAEGAGAHAGLLDTLLFATAAELVGVMSAALDMAVEYVKTRQQFGRPIGSFQAIQHRAVDDFARIVSCRSLLFQVAGQSTELTSAMASALKAHCGGEALKVTKSVIQMHGAIGFTDEYDAGLYLKRAMLLSAWLGNEAQHRKRYAALLQPEQVG